MSAEGRWCVGQEKGKGGTLIFPGWIAWGFFLGFAEKDELFFNFWLSCGEVNAGAGTKMGTDYFLTYSCVYEHHLAGLVGVGREEGAIFKIINCVLCVSKISTYMYLFKHTDNTYKKIYLWG